MCVEQHSHRKDKRYAPRAATAFQTSATGGAPRAFAARTTHDVHVRPRDVRARAAHTHIHTLGRVDWLRLSVLCTTLRTCVRARVARHGVNLYVCMCACVSRDTQLDSRTERESWVGKMVSKLFPEYGRFSGVTQQSLEPNPTN